MNTSKYRGRFAPSPTGPLHFGSLVTALASYCEAKQQQGQWLLRIDDLDQTRCIDGMDQTLIRSLDAFGFEWDEEIAYQSLSNDQYTDMFERLRRESHVYPCSCSRKDITKIARQGIEGAVYPQTCKSGVQDTTKKLAHRLITASNSIEFSDGLYGPQSQNIAEEIGDFIIKRADGYFAYQLAVIIDDIEANITHVVRGADLLLSSARQIYLYQLLNKQSPSYTHIPLVFDNVGKKLSKRDAANPVDDSSPLASLTAAWQFLKQRPIDSGIQSIESFWPWAIKHWKLENCLDE